MDDRQRAGGAEEARSEKIREEIETLISDSLFGFRRLRETLASGGTVTSAYWLVHHVNRIHDLLGELNGFTPPDEDISVYAEPLPSSALPARLVARWEQPDVLPEEDNG